MTLPVPTWVWGTSARVDKANSIPAPAAPSASLSAKEIYQRAAPSVVLILAAEKEGAGELGTGSVIEGGRVLTNAHVVINDKTGRPFAAVRVYLKPERVTGDTKRDLRSPVVAKVARDRWMERLARRHPGYGFEVDKGYGTKAHLSALAELGPCAAHRLTYEPVARQAVPR